MRDSRDITNAEQTRAHAKTRSFVTSVSKWIVNSEGEIVGEIHKAFKRISRKLGKEAIKVRRSKLEIYLEILTVLDSKGSTNAAQLVHKIKMNHQVLMERLSFLIEKNLVEHQITALEEVYTLTAKGQKVLRVITPIVTQARKAQAILH